SGVAAIPGACRSVPAWHRPAWRLALPGGIDRESNQPLPGPAAATAAAREIAAAAPAVPGWRPGWTAGPIRPPLPGSVWSWGLTMGLAAPGLMAAGLAGGSAPVGMDRSPESARNR